MQPFLILNLSGTYHVMYSCSQKTCRRVLAIAIFLWILLPVCLTFLALYWTIFTPSFALTFLLYLLPRFTTVFQALTTRPSFFSRFLLPGQHEFLEPS